MSSQRMLRHILLMVIGLNALIFLLVAEPEGTTQVLVAAVAALTFLAGIWYTARDLLSPN